MSTNERRRFFSDDLGSKIGKIRKGEVVVVNVVAEPLQEKYNQIILKSEELHELEKKGKVLYKSFDDLPVDYVKQVMTLSYEIENMSASFWLAVNEQYNTWKTPVGIRNGYCLVKIKHPKEIFDEIRKHLQQLTEDLGFDAEDKTEDE